MDTLPDEMLLHIFSFISTYELSTVLIKISCRWQRLINRSVLRIRRAVDLDKVYDGLKAVIVTDRVSLLGDASSLVTCIVVLAPKLEELIISRDYPLTDEDFRYLIHLPHLKHLDVFSKKKCVDKNTFINPSITSLVINDPIGVGFLKNIAESNQLQGFHIFGRCQFFPIREMMNFLQTQAPYLKDLTLRCPELTDERYRIIGQCTKLVSLQLHTCVLLTKNGASYFENLTNLRRLHLTGATMLRQRGMHRLVASLPPHLVELNLSGSQFIDEHCAALAARLPALRALELWRSALGGDALLRLARRLPALQALSTDVAFHDHHLRALAGLPRLRCLRCRRRPARVRRAPPSPAAAPRVRPAPPPARECLRGDDEGPSADRYYHWTRGVLMRALSSPHPDLVRDQIIVDVEDFCTDDLHLADPCADDLPSWDASPPGSLHQHVPVRMLVRSSAPNWALLYVQKAGAEHCEEGAGAQRLPPGYTFVVEDVNARNSTIVHKMFNKGGLYHHHPVAALEHECDGSPQMEAETDYDDEDDDNVYIEVEEVLAPEEAAPPPQWVRRLCSCVCRRL